MELNEVKELVKESLSVANSYLDTMFVEARFFDKNSFANESVKSVFDKYYYLIKFNNDWLKEAKEEDILFETYRQARHAYQQVQIEFRKKLIAVDAFVEDEETIKDWKEDLAYYSEYSEDDEDDEDFIQQSCEIDAIAFAKLLLKVVNSYDYNVPAIIAERVENNIESILKVINIF